MVRFKKNLIYFLVCNQNYELNKEADFVQFHSDSAAFLEFLTINEAYNL